MFPLWKSLLLKHLYKVSTPHTPGTGKHKSLTDHGYHSQEVLTSGQRVFPFPVKPSFLRAVQMWDVLGTELAGGVYLARELF